MFTKIIDSKNVGFHVSQNDIWVYNVGHKIDEETFSLIDDRKYRRINPRTKLTPELEIARVEYDSFEEIVHRIKIEGYESLSYDKAFEDYHDYKKIFDNVVVGVFIIPKSTTYYKAHGSFVSEKIIFAGILENPKQL